MTTATTPRRATTSGTAKARRATSSSWTKPALRTAPRTPKVAVRARSGRPRTPFVLLVLGLLIGGLCLLLALNTAAAASELRRHSLVDTNSTLTDQIAGLQSNIAAAQAPAALAKAAASLGMVPNPNAAFLQVQPDGTVKVLGSPKPATPPPVPTPTPTTVPLSTDAR